MYDTIKMWRIKLNVSYSIHFFIGVIQDFPLKKKYSFNECYLITKTIKINMILINFFKEKVFLLQIMGGIKQAADH